MIYGGIHVRPDQEILTTEHEHYATNSVSEFRTQKDGTQVRKIKLFEDPHNGLDRRNAGLDRPQHPPRNPRAGHDLGALRQRREAAASARSANWSTSKTATASEKDRILYVVDGVHGFGVEDLDFPDMHCDFFIAGTHKWMFGPRGTGIICARSDEMKDVTPTIPTFSEATTFSTMMTPGGYHSFEHRWALTEAFKLHLDLGKAEVQARIHELNSYLKKRLQEHSRIELVTPLSPEFSAGFTFFRIKDQRLRRGRRLPDGPTAWSATPSTAMSAR